MVDYTGKFLELSSLLHLYLASTIQDISGMLVTRQLQQSQQNPVMMIFYIKFYSIILYPQHTFS